MKRKQGAYKFISFIALFSFLFLVTSPGYTQSQQGSRISGKILSSDKNTPIGGAIVKAAEIESKKIYESKPTIENGYYEILGLEKGTYDIAVQIDNGLYIANKLLNIGEGEAHTLSLALNETPPGQDEEITPEEFEKKSKKIGFWDNPLVAVIAITGVALVVGLAIDQFTEDDEPPSPWQ